MSAVAKARPVESVDERLFSIDAEKAVIGGFLRAEDGAEAWKLIDPPLRAAEFFRRDHRIAYAGIETLHREGKPHDIVTTSQFLQARGELDEAGGMAYLGKLARDTPTVANISAYADIVRERAQRRALTSQGEQLIEDAVTSRDIPIAVLIEKAKDALEKIKSAPGVGPTSWPEPVNILRELAAQPFEVADLPACLAEWPAAYSARTGIDRSIAITTAVAAAGAALTDEFHVVADASTNWRQPARTWMLTIGRPGAGKSPAQAEMIRPLWTIQREQFAEYERLVAAAPADAEPPPKPPLAVLGDATIEALSERLRYTRRGLLIANDEFEGFLGSMDQYRGGKGPSRDRAEYLRLFDGGPHTIERVQRGSVFVENWGVSILSATTPATMARFKRHMPEDGLLQRFLIVCADRQTPGTHGPLPDATRAAYEETIRRLYAATPRAHAGNVPLSLEAARIFADWRTSNQMLQEAMGVLSPPFEAHIAKHPTILLRIALAFHAAQIVNLEHPQARDPAAWPIPAATMQIAIRFMRRAAQHAMPVYLGMGGGSEAFDLARDIGRAVIAQSGSHLARRDLIQRVRAFRSAEDHIKNAALMVLIDSGWLRPSDEGYAKAHPSRYDVNPLLAVRLAAEAQRERERRAAVRELIAETVRESRSDD